MDTLTFIRHQTRLILEAEKKAARKVNRIGSTSAGSEQAIGLATSNPAELLKRLNVGGYKKGSGSRSNEIKIFIEKVMRSSLEMGMAFERPKLESDGIIIPLRTIEDKLPAIKHTQAPRYIRASLIACGLYDRDKVKVQSVDGPDDYAVRILIRD